MRLSAARHWAMGYPQWAILVAAMAVTAWAEHAAECSRILAEHLPMAFVAPNQLRLFAVRGTDALRVDVTVGSEQAVGGQRIHAGVC